MNNQKDFLALLEEIEKVKLSNILVIVEGIKDKIALQEIGIKNIFVINREGKGLYEKIERIHDRNKEVIVLTDLDDEGKKIYSIIKRNFSHNGIKINDSIRNLLIKLKISHVEGLDSFIKNHYKNNLCL